MEKRGSCGLWATHQLDAARELRQTRGPSQPHPTATSCHPQRWRTPTPTFPTAGLPESNRSNPTQRDDGGFRQSDHLRPCPQLLLHMVPAPAHLPTASMRNQERYLPRLHHQPRPPPPASRLAPPQRTAQNVENSTLNTRRIYEYGGEGAPACLSNGLVAS